MKVKIILIGVLLTLTFLMYAQQSKDEIMVEVNKEINEAMVEVSEAMKDVKTIQMDIDMDFDPSDAFMGVYLANIDFEDAYDMHYNYNYGVLIKGTTQNGPAQQAGLMKGDIVMEFDGEKAYHEGYLSQLIKSKPIGKQVPIKFFRYDKIYETTLTIGSREEFSKKKKGGQDLTDSTPKKKRLSVGHGGGSWYPIWFMPDVTEMNDFLHKLDFDEETFSEDGFLMHGGGGHGNVGKGWFIGGMGAGYENSQNTRHDWAHIDENGILDTVNVSRIAKYGVSFGGVTLDKRIALSKKIVSSFGIMLGGGYNYYKIKQVDYNTYDFDFVNNPSEQMDETYNFSSSLAYDNTFFIVQPKATVMYKLLDWLALRAEVGYIKSYSGKGWKMEWNGKKVKVDNEPDINMDGLTICVGPWFGF